MSERKEEKQANGGVTIHGGSAGPAPEPGTETNELALFSLFLGVFWVFGFGSVAAIYLGWKALREIGQNEARERGRIFAWTGIVTGLFGLTSVALIFAVAFAPS